MLYYSKSLAGFYDDALHPTIPGDAVEVSVGLHAQLMRMQSEGKEIIGDERGHPIAVDPAPLKKHQLESIARVQREESLRATDWLVARHRDEIDAGGNTTLSTEQVGQLQDYRKALRDWPEMAGFPESETMPTRPGWLSDWLPIGQ